jgi:hypothetical protein
LSMRQVLSFNLAATPCTRKSQSCILCRCSWMIFGNYNLFHIPDWGRKEETEETAEPICNRSFFLSWDIKERRETSRSNQNRVSSTASPMILTSKETSGSELVDWISASAQIPALTPVTPVLWVTPVVVRNFTRTGCMGKGEQDPIATLEAAICAGNCWFPQWI